MRFDINFQRRDRVETFLEHFTKIIYRRDSILILILFLILASISLFYFSYSKELPPPSKKDIQLSQQLKEMNLKREKVARILRILEELKEDRIVWSEKLWALDKNLASGLWLTGIETKAIKSEKGGSRQMSKVDALIFQGLTENREIKAADPVKRFIQNLAEDPSFSENYDTPILMGISKAKSADKELNEIEICLIRKKDGENK